MTWPSHPWRAASWIDDKPSGHGSGTDADTEGSAPAAEIASSTTRAAGVSTAPVTTTG